MYIPQQYHDLTITELEEQLTQITGKVKDSTVTVRDFIAYRHLRNTLDFFIATAEAWPDTPADVEAPF